MALILLRKKCFNNPTNHDWTKNWLRRPPVTSSVNGRKCLPFKGDHLIDSFSTPWMRHLQLFLENQGSKNIEARLNDEFRFNCRKIFREIFLIGQCFSTFFGSRHPFLVKTFGGTLTLVNYYFEAPLKLSIVKFHEEYQQITRKSNIKRHPLDLFTAP